MKPQPTSFLEPDGTLALSTPRPFLPLLRPARFKGARGGRGGAKSHFVAERLVASCLERHQRIACLREYQTSIKESVKALLEDKIKQFHLDSKFYSTEVEIRGPNDSLFVFKGLRDFVSRPGGPATGLKSLESFTKGWVEEAQTISKRSLDILTPTFRGNPTMEQMPELWFTWNPGRATDPIEVLFNENEGDQDFVCVTTTFMDNPWFESTGLRRDMERDRARDPGKYAHVWLGQYLTRSEAQVFRNWRIEEFETPDDARLYFGADWGFGDPTVLVRCWIRGHELFVDHEAYSTNCPIEAIPALFNTVPGAKKWRIRADSARPETIDYVKRRKFNITPSIKGPGSVEDGIEFLKSYDIVVHPRCQHTIGELTTFSYKIDPRTDEVLPQLADNNNHVIDSLRYALEDERHAGRPIILSPTAMQRFATVPTRNRFAASSGGGGPRATMITRNRFARAR